MIAHHNHDHDHDHYRQHHRQLRRPRNFSFSPVVSSQKRMPDMYETTHPRKNVKRDLSAKDTEVGPQNVVAPSLI